MSIVRASFYEIARRLIDASATDDVCKGLVSGTLTAKSTSPVIGAIASGRDGVREAVLSLQELWRADFQMLDGPALCLVLRAVSGSIKQEQLRATQTEVVWTGPKVAGSFLRATRQVVQDIIDGAKSELLVVGYWIAAPEDEEGIVQDIIELIAAAVRRGVAVTMVLDHGKKPYGKDNRQILLDLWPAGVALPRLLTWRIGEDEKHRKLHAKVLVADEQDALVTSANLTMYALDINMEMGARLAGDPAAKIADHFTRLIASEILEPYGP